MIAGAAAGYPYYSNCGDYYYGSYYGSCDAYSYGYPYPYYNYGYGFGGPVFFGGGRFHHGFHDRGFAFHGGGSHFAGGNFGHAGGFGAGHFGGFAGGHTGGFGGSHFAGANFGHMGGFGGAHLAAAAPLWRLRRSLSAVGGMPACPDDPPSGGPCAARFRSLKTSAATTPDLSDTAATIRWRGAAIRPIPGAGRRREPAYGAPINLALFAAGEPSPRLLRFLIRKGPSRAPDRTEEVVMTHNIARTSAIALGVAAFVSFSSFSARADTPGASNPAPASTRGRALGCAPGEARVNGARSVNRVRSLAQ